MKIILISVLLAITLLLSGVADDTILKDIGDLSSEEISKAVREAKKDSLTSQQDFEELVSEMEKISGLFNLYRNLDDGTVYLEIKPEQLDKNFLLTLTRQSGDAYYFDASAMMWSYPVHFHRINKRIQIRQDNLLFRSSDPALDKALKNSISPSLIASTEITGKPHKVTGAILIKADDLFLKDLPSVEYFTDRWQTKYSYDQENSYFNYVKSFPENTELEVFLHYKSHAYNDIFTLSDSRSMMHRYHYSISLIPDSDFRPRPADDRIGFFTTTYQDYTDLSTDTPYIRYINRWNLEKEDPEATSSKARNPIVFWLENTIPEKYRSAVRKGVLLWNDAFAAIGIEDAILVKDMPEDAEWDPADSRYNTIRWIIQPQGGYAVGPSHANPYTGEIYDADIRISVDFIRYFFQEFQDMISPQSQLNYIPDDTRFDNHLTDAFGQQISFAASFLRGKNLLNNEESREKFVEQGIISLVVHEVGHTLGLRHNFKASTCYSLKQLQNADFTRENGICNSVMDYPAVNLSLSEDDQGDYFQIKPGPWDYWMIEYGYAHFKEEKEDKMLEKIARKCTDPLLDYATDEDTFGFSTRGMDPHSNIFDLGSDPIEFHEYRLRLAQEIWKDIADNFEKPGKSYKVLLPVFNQALGEYRLAAHNISKYIGGLYTHRDHIGDPSARPPFEPVLKAEQERALNFLISNILSERSFQFSPELLNKLVYEKMDTFSYNIWSRERIDYPVHQQIKYIQEIVFSHLYDPLVLQRLQDNELRIHDQDEGFGLGDLFPRIRQAIWDDHQDVNQNSSLRRQLHDLHLSYLTDIALQKNKAIPREAVALARYDLLEIRKICETSLEKSVIPVQKAHLLDIINRIDTSLNPIIQL